MKSKPLKHAKRFYHGDNIGCFADWEIKLAVDWLKEWQIQSNEGISVEHIECQKCHKKFVFVFARFKSCLEIRCKDCLFDEAFEDVTREATIGKPKR